MQRKARPHGKFLSLRDAEAEYGLPYHTMYRWVENGKLPRLDADAVGKAILVKRVDLEAFSTPT